MQLQVDNTTRCCQAVTNGDVDIAVVGGAIPSALEHLVQVGAGLADVCIKPVPYTPEQAAASSLMGAGGGPYAPVALFGACCKLLQRGCTTGILLYATHSHKQMLLCPRRPCCLCPAACCTGVPRAVAHLQPANYTEASQAVLSAHMSDVISSSLHCPPCR